MKLLRLGLVVACFGVAIGVAREVPGGIEVFLADLAEGKETAADGSSYLAAGAEDHLLATLASLLGTYDFETEKAWVVDEDCLLKLKAVEDKEIVVLTLRLVLVGDHWRLCGKPLMREIRLPGDKKKKDDTGRLRHQANRLRAEILAEQALLEGVEGFLKEMDEKHGE